MEEGLGNKLLFVLECFFVQIAVVEVESDPEEKAGLSHEEEKA